MQKILITGGSGLVGTRLTELLEQKGYTVAWLGRAKSSKRTSFTWNIEEQSIEAGALEWADAIIHLAGAGVADQRWTPSRKKEIFDSRTQSTQLLCNELTKMPNAVKAFISASAIGLYGFSLSNHELDEAAEPGTDFLAHVVKAWEFEADRIARLGIRTCKLRIGIVLSEKGGALTEIAKPIKYFVGSPLGSGTQYVSWIHMDDLCQMFIHLLEHPELSGAFNGTGPYAVTNQALTKAIAHTLNRPVLPVNVPGFAVRLLVGEMADLILQGSHVSSKKIQNSGFTFTFDTLDKALNNLLKK